MLSSRKWNYSGKRTKMAPKGTIRTHKKTGERWEWKNRTWVKAWEDVPEAWATNGITDSLTDALKKSGW